MSQPIVIDSESVGDPGQFRALTELEERFSALPEAAHDLGRVILIVSRTAGGRRETPHRVRLGFDTGVPGDSWGSRAERKAEAQIAVMQRDVAELIANGQPLALFGDNLFLDLDLSARNLPTGSRLRIGDALLEVTPKPHTGCHKFRARFGADALRFVNMAELRHRNLRGIYLRVVDDGEIAVGDTVQVITRG